jgi:hypothetical protein
MLHECLCTGSNTQGIPSLEGLFLHKQLPLWLLPLFTILIPKVAEGYML